MGVLLVPICIKVNSSVSLTEADPYLLGKESITHGGGRITWGQMGKGNRGVAGGKEGKVTCFIIFLRAIRVYLQQCSDIAILMQCGEAAYHSVVTET